MNYGNISFQSYCWVLGTTSFRVAQMNLRIEEQLLHLRQFSRNITEDGGAWQWKGNNALQALFYNYLKESGALTGDAPRPDKDARQKTSGLPTLGFTDYDRVITDAGNELLRNVEDGIFDTDNYFMVPADSYIYLKQLLKTSLNLRGQEHVRPYFVLAHLLNKFDYLSFEEFEVLLPLIVDEHSLSVVSDNLQRSRLGEISHDDIIYETLITKDNYKAAYKLWMNHPVDENLITTIGMNRKSRSYDKKYLPLYHALHKAFLDRDQSTKSLIELYDLLGTATGSQHWKRLIFADATSAAIRKEGTAAFSSTNPFESITNETDLKQLFFRYLHLYKARATLSDYFDLNRRYFKLTDTVLFTDRKVEFDTIPKAFFALVGDKLLKPMFTRSDKLYGSLTLKEISPILDISEQELLRTLSAEFGIELTTLTGAKSVVQDQRYERLHELLDTRFKKEVMLELLDCFSTRDDQRIKELVTDDATPSTIFEYILALIWYEFSGRTGDVLNFMKLSLEADLMPRTHAQGGGADIIFEYPENTAYPRHDMLIEVTLADGTNARRMEMEPVPRHLGTHILETHNDDDYCVFVAPTIDVNVANDFRQRKTSGYWSEEGQNVSLKIIPVEIQQIRALVAMNSNYDYLYQQFDKAHRSEETNPLHWRKEIAELLNPKPHPSTKIYKQGTEQIGATRK